MSFLLDCPNCGKRAVSEFTFRGEITSRPDPQADFSTWVEYVYLRDNICGEQTEWWYHGGGCRRWFLVTRDTQNNTHHKSAWFNDHNCNLSESI